VCLYFHEFVCTVLYVDNCQLVNTGLVEINTGLLSTWDYRIELNADRNRRTEGQYLWQQVPRTFAVGVRLSPHE